MSGWSGWSGGWRDGRQCRRARQAAASVPVLTRPLAVRLVVIICSLRAVPPNICIVEELAEGGSLYTLLHGRPGERRRRPLPYPRLLQVSWHVSLLMSWHVSLVMLPAHRPGPGLREQQ